MLLFLSRHCILRGISYINLRTRFSYGEGTYRKPIAFVACPHNKLFNANSFGTRTLYLVWMDCVEASPSQFTSNKYRHRNHQLLSHKHSLGGSMFDSFITFICQTHKFCICHTPVLHSRADCHRWQSLLMLTEATRCYGISFFMKVFDKKHRYLPQKYEMVIQFLIQIKLSLIVMLGGNITYVAH